MAVAAFNAFQRLVKTTLANTDALSHILLAHLRAEGGRSDHDIGGVVEGGASQPERSSKTPGRNSSRRRDDAEDR